VRLSQPHSWGTDADVERVARRDFPEEHASVLAILAEYGGQDWHREQTRVRLAVLKLADRSLEKLRYWIEQAKSDYRDVLGPAEYPTYGKKWFRIARMADEDHNQIVESDWAQYEKWLKG